jgi:hypothetical protein
VHYVLADNNQVVPKFFDVPRRIIDVIKCPHMVSAFLKWMRGDPVPPHPANLNISPGPNNCDFSIDFDDPRQDFLISFETNFHTDDKQIRLLEFTPPFRSKSIVISPDCYKRIIDIPSLNNLYDVSEHVINM